MACLQAGTVVSATVEQAIENCLIVCVKHKSRIFRGVLFDEKNAVVSRRSFRGQTSSLEESEKNCNGGSNLGNGGARSSSRQASLFYKRHNPIRFRKVASSSSEVTVFTDLNTGVVKQHLESGCSSSVEGKGTMKKTAAAPSDQKTRQVQANKAKEISRKKPHSVSQVDVQRSKTDSNLKLRTAQNQQSCSNPQKTLKAKGADQRMMVAASKGVNKNGSRKKMLAKCEKTNDTEVAKGVLKSFVSEDAKEKAITPTQYKILTRPCSVPVVPVNTSPNILVQSRTAGTVMVINTLLSSMGTQTSKLLPIKSLSTPNNVVQSINKNQDLDGNKEHTPKFIEQTVNSETQENVENESVEAVSTTAARVSNDPTSDKNVGTNTVPVCDHDEATAENKTVSSPEDHNYGKTCIGKGGMVINSFASSEEKELMGICGLKRHNTTVKRSARLIEKKARTLARPLAERKECELGVSCTASNVVRLGELKHLDQEKDITEQLGPGLVNALQSSIKPDKTSTDLKSMQKRTKGAVTKYTQRMSWVLKPETATGHKSAPVSVGDIVWGKVHGHPWWPGKVLAVGGIRNDGSDNPWDRDAHVSWFGSSTSSIMHLQALQLFSPNFSKRHKRQKKGCYRVAVRQAQEAVKARAVKEL